MGDFRKKKLRKVERNRNRPNCNAIETENKQSIY